MNNFKSQQMQTAKQQEKERNEILETIRRKRLSTKLCMGCENEHQVQ